MKLRKVDEKTWVNVGIGNVTSVVDKSWTSTTTGEHPYSEHPYALISFVDGAQIEVLRRGVDVVAALEAGDRP